MSNSRGGSYPGGGSIVSASTIAKLDHRHRHEFDERQLPHNPPRVESPAMDDAQFWFDEHRQIAEAVLVQNPAMLAHVVFELRRELKELRDEMEASRTT